MPHHNIYVAMITINIPATKISRKKGHTPLILIVMDTINTRRDKRRPDNPLLRYMSFQFKQDSSIWWWREFPRRSNYLHTLHGPAPLAATNPVHHTSPHNIIVSLSLTCQILFFNNSPLKQGWIRLGHAFRGTISLIYFN